MSNPTRYDPVVREVYDEHEAHMDPNPRGDYVEWSEFESMQDDLQRQVQLLEEMIEKAKDALS